MAEAAVNQDVAGTRTLDRRGCSSAVSDELAPEAWFETAAQACHPGATRIGSLTTRLLEPGAPTTFEIPAAARGSCFSAYAVVAPTLLPLVVEILDDKNGSQVLGTLRAIHVAIPELGPLCAIHGQFKELRFNVVSGHAGPITLAFFAQQ